MSNEKLESKDVAIGCIGFIIACICLIPVGVIALLFAIHMLPLLILVGMTWVGITFFSGLFGGGKK